MDLKIKFFGENNLVSVYKADNMREPLLQIEQDADGVIQENIDGLVRLLRTHKEYNGIAEFTRRVRLKDCAYYLRFFGDEENLVSLHHTPKGSSFAYIAEFEDEIDSDLEAITQLFIDEKQLRGNTPIILGLTKQDKKRGQPNQRDYAKHSFNPKTGYPPNLAGTAFARWVYDSAVDGEKNLTITKAATILHEKANIPFSTLMYVMSKGVFSPKTQSALDRYLQSKK